MASEEVWKIKREGINNQGNYPRRPDCGPDAPNQNAYQCINADKSRYSSNPDGSQYFHDGRGYERYTAPDGNQYESRNGSDWKYVPERK